MLFKYTSFRTKFSLYSHRFHVFDDPCEVGGIGIPVRFVRLTICLVVNVVPRHSVVEVERQASSHRERSLHLPRSLEQLEDAVSLRVVRQERAPLNAFVFFARVWMPVVLHASFDFILDFYYVTIGISCEPSSTAFVHSPLHSAGRTVSFHFRPANSAYGALLGVLCRVFNTRRVKLVHTTCHSTHPFTVVQLVQTYLAHFELARFNFDWCKEVTILFGLIGIVVEQNLLIGFDSSILRRRYVLVVVFVLIVKHIRSFAEWVVTPCSHPPGSIIIVPWSAVA